MRLMVHALFLFFVHLGAFGLLMLGVLDSSFLFLPLGNDLLLIALTVRHHTELPLYVAMAAAGSTLGCYLVDLIVRKGGGAGLKMVLSPKRLTYMEKKVGDRAAAALLVATYPGSAALPVYDCDCRRVRSALPTRQDAGHHRGRARGSLHHHRTAGHLAGTAHVEDCRDTGVRVVHGRVHRPMRRWQCDLHVQMGTRQQVENL